MRIIFTNGCFDILHYGHLKLLAYCHELAHQAPQGGQGKVIVGINSDSSVRRLKGKNRPINSQIDRTYMLESLRYVDQVEVFDEDTPHKLIQQIEPNLIVKGSQAIPGAYETGNYEVKIFDHIDGYSTTKIINETFNR